MADINIGLVLILIIHCFKNLNQFFTTVNTSFSFGKVKLVPVTWGEPAGRIRFHCFFLMYLFLIYINIQTISLHQLLGVPKIEDYTHFKSQKFNKFYHLDIRPNGNLPFPKVLSIYEGVGSIL